MAMAKIPCPDCKGQGFHLKREGHGYYRDGSFGHNQWEDCHPCGGSGDARERLDYQYPAEKCATPSDASQADSNTRSGDAA